MREERRQHRMIRAVSALLCLAMAAAASGARAQTVDDGSGAALGPADTRAVLDLIGRHLNSPDTKVTVLRRSGGSIICGSVNVKNRDGLYTGERGFVVDLPRSFFGRVPDGPELMTFRPGEAYQAMERIRQLYFARCLD